MTLIKYSDTIQFYAKYGLYVSCDLNFTNIDHSIFIDWVKATDIIRNQNAKYPSQWCLQHVSNLEFNYDSVLSTYEIFK